MLLRFVVLCGGALALAGCHTIDAIHRIVRPSPVTAVWVEPGEDGVTWRSTRVPPVLLPLRPTTRLLNHFGSASLFWSILIHSFERVMLPDR